MNEDWFEAEQQAAGITRSSTLLSTPYNEVGYGDKKPLKM